MKMFRLLMLALLPALAVTAVARDVPPAYAMPADQAKRTDLALLVVPYTIDIDMVDGIAWKGLNPFARRGEIKVYVTPGRHEVNVQYDMVYDIDADNHEVVKSKKMVLTWIAEPSKTYRVTHAAFRNLDAAREGVKNFVVHIEDEKGGNHIVAASQASSNWKGETTVNQRPDLVNAALVASPAAVAPAPAAPGGGVNTLDLLKFTWQSASSADRATFLDWVKEHP